MNTVSISIPILKWVIRLLILLVFAATLWFWTDPETIRTLGADMSLVDKYGGFDSLAPWQWITGFLIDLLPVLFLTYALWRLHGLLLLIEEGRWFDPLSEQTCLVIGRSMLLYLLTSFLNETLLILMLTITNAPGKKELSISLSSDVILGLVPALMAFVIAQLLRVAREQRDELNQII